MAHGSGIVAFGCGIKSGSTLSAAGFGNSHSFAVCLSAAMASLNSEAKRQTSRTEDFLQEKSNS